MAELIDYESGIPPYRQLAAILRARIEAGEIKGRFPSDRTISQEYGVATGTVRKAVAILRDEGYIMTAHGWGSQVMPPDQRGEG